MTTTIQSQPLDLLVKINPWEPKHEWESRLLFVEDNLDRHGLERAIHLSLVWANVNFLGCSYPSHTQLLVSDYPVPDQELLKAERKKRERAERKRRASMGGESSEEAEIASKRPRSQTKHSSSGSDGAHNSSADDTDASFEHITQQVDALISAIRKQHEKKKMDDQRLKNDSVTVPDEVLKMLRTMCMCNQCFCPGTSPSSQVNSIVQRYTARFDKSFAYDFTFTDNKSTTECKFLINGQFVTSASNENKKVAKQKTAEQFVKMVNDYYKENGKPCCPNE